MSATSCRRSPCETAWLAASRTAGSAAVFIASQGRFNARTVLEALTKAGESLALGRHQNAEDSAYAAVYLLSDESAQVSGAVLNVDAGGSTLPIQPGAPYVV